MKQWDWFAQPVPHFTLKGETVVTSNPGRFCTLIAATLMIAFVVTKLTMLHSRHNPSISMADVPQFYDINHSFDAEENNFQIAIGVVDYGSKRPIDDPEYVRWVPRIHNVIDGVLVEKNLKFHKCTEEDFEQFYPPQRRSLPRLQQLKDTNALICLEAQELQEHRIEVWGQDDNEDHQTLEFVLLPCIEDLENNVCVGRTLEETKEYIGSPDILFYHNFERFDVNDFNRDTKIVRESVVKNQQFTLDGGPLFMNSNVHLNIVEDEIDYLQIGQHDEETYFDYIIELPEPSSHNRFPEKYKFIGIEVYFHYDRIQINRQTYDLLQCLGDIGGLYEVIYITGYLLTLPFTQFTLNSKLLRNLFDERNFNKNDEKNTTLNGRIKTEFESFKSFDSKPHFQLKDLMKYFCFQKKMRRNMSKSREILKKEMDLEKFIHRQRVTLSALMGLLSGSQQFFVHRLSKLYIDKDKTASEDSPDFLPMKQDADTYIDKMVSNAKRSAGSVDRRFLNFFKDMKNVKLSIDDSEEEEQKALRRQPRFAKTQSLKKQRINQPDAITEIEEEFEALQSTISAIDMQQEQLSQKSSKQTQSKDYFPGTNQDRENEGQRDVWENMPNIKKISSILSASVQNTSTKQYPGQLKAIKEDSDAGFESPRFDPNIEIRHNDNSKEYSELRKEAKLQKVYSQSPMTNNPNPIKTSKTIQSIPLKQYSLEEMGWEIKDSRRE